MQFIKIDTDTPSLNITGSTDAYLYIKKNNNNEPELRLMCNKDGSANGFRDYMFALNSSLVTVNNLSTDDIIVCNCASGTLFKLANTITASKCNILISNFVRVPGKSVLIKCDIGANVTIKYQSTEYFNTNSGSNYTAGTYYI